MISAYFDVKPRKAASVPVRQAAPEEDRRHVKSEQVFKPSPQAITPGLVMHAQFKPMVVGSFDRSDVDEDETNEFYEDEDNADGDDDDDDDDDDDAFPETEELESLTDATAVDEMDLNADEPGDSAIDAHFFSKARRKDNKNVMGIVFSGPMLCCEEEDFD
jgi:hypothetical protein